MAVSHDAGPDYRNVSDAADNGLVVTPGAAGAVIGRSQSFGDIFDV